MEMSHPVRANFAGGVPCCSELEFRDRKKGVTEMAMAMKKITYDLMMMILSCRQNGRKILTIDFVSSEAISTSRNGTIRSHSASCAQRQANATQHLLGLDFIQSAVGLAQAPTHA